MDVILNIGLAVNGNSNIGSGTAIREVIATFGAASFKFKHSDTELTCIACVQFTDGAAAWHKVYHLAQLLSQDCIAVYTPSIGKGELIGPRSEAWGAFNPEFFILPDGTRLSGPVAQAA
jgi:hypothetical protein